MNQPFLWGGLLAFAIAVGVVRAVRGPFLPGRAVRLGPVARTVAVLSVAALVFHCSAMFFEPWVNAISFLRPLAAEVNAMGGVSQVAYWVPAALLLLAWRRVWWPGLVLLAVTLVGVGVTMYWPYPLVVHLGWLAAVIVVGVLVSTALTGRRRAVPGRAA
ncbi:hypothetical protein D6T64_05995 [Cryobacterium melibiosiphilum]|uniref:Uncharacterized protein n=1 Tax=Cryobacterium melibiosiphilum TaxID=995039 RepID=A0A3A5MR37_9MICO|nr:hypothetical protein [Cryobacterium melibiosiphilum]RJT89638.1 hypothetical protein D6T64_05995 [Cryobacterium melibiosiphilum]